jgi:uncharacterized protein (UPF0332 family)
MSFKPNSFIDISKELESGKTEAHFRSVINRAYYGAFGFIKNRLQIMSTDISVHREVIDTLKHSQDQNYKLAGTKLEGLFKKRKEADYKYNVEIRSTSCQYTIKEAESIIELIKKNP